LLDLINTGFRVYLRNSLKQSWRSVYTSPLPVVL